jgi:hypothetical protein
VVHVRTVKTVSGATAGHVAWSSPRGSRKVEHIGSAHDDAEVLKAAARQRLAAGQLELGLGVVADAGMISEANQKAIEAAGCRSSSA